MINPFGFDDEDYEVKAGYLIDEHTFANAFFKVTWLLERHWTVIKLILDESWSRLPHDVRDESADGSENDATHRSGTYLPHTLASASMALIEYASNSNNFRLQKTPCFFSSFAVKSHRWRKSRVTVSGDEQPPHECELSGNGSCCRHAACAAELPQDVCERRWQAARSLAVLIALLDCIVGFEAANFHDAQYERQQARFY